MLKIVNISAHLTVLEKQVNQICEKWIGSIYDQKPNIEITIT